MKRLPRKRRRRPSPRGRSERGLLVHKSPENGSFWNDLADDEIAETRFIAQFTNILNDFLDNYEPEADGMISASPRRRLLAQRPSRADVRCTNNRIAHSVQTLKHLFIVLVTHTHLYFIQRLASGFPRVAARRAIQIQPPFAIDKMSPHRAVVGPCLSRWRPSRSKTCSRARPASLTKLRASHAPHASPAASHARDYSPIAFPSMRRDDEDERARAGRGARSMTCSRVRRRR